MTTFTIKLTLPGRQVHRHDADLELLRSSAERHPFPVLALVLSMAAVVLGGAALSLRIDSDTGSLLVALAPHWVCQQLQIIPASLKPQVRPIRRLPGLLR